jgi:23S rRNA (guanosine2251-2'-O)-methyltransferase
MSALSLKNPHSALAALQVRPQDVLEIRLARRAPRDAWQQVVEAATAAGVPVRVMPGAEQTRHRRGEEKDGRTSVAEALVRERQPVELDELFATDARTGLWIALDQLQDPHNTGAIFRTAAFFGVRGIVMTRHKSAPVTATVCDVASGGVEHVPFTLVANLRQALDAAKQSGLWVLGTSEHARQSLWQVDRERKWLVVLGNEESGLRRLTEETCDEVCAIPAVGQVGSLNVSVATGILLAAMSRPAG